MDSEQSISPLKSQQMQANGNNGFSTDASQPNGPYRRIALLISELEVGGAEQNLVRLALGLQSRGHWVTVYSLDPAPPTSQAALVQKLQAASVPLRFLALTPNRVANRRTRQALLQAQSVDRIDLVYSFLFRANLANVWANRWPLLDHPLQTAARWLSRLRPTGLLDKNTPPTPNTPTNPSPSVVIGLRQADPRPLVRRLEAILLRYAHASVCVSSQVAQHYAPSKTLLAPHEVARGRCHQVLVISNGIETRADGLAGNCPPNPPADLLACLDAAPSLHPKATNNAPESSRPATQDGTSGPLPVLLYVGRLTHQKGLDLLLAAAPALLAQLPRHHLVLVGQGDQRQALEEQAQSLACRDRIHFLGWRPNPLDYLAAAQVVLLHSRWEGQPNVILEAMSLGKPVVTTLTDGIQELFQEPNSATRGTMPDHRADQTPSSSQSALSSQPTQLTAAAARAAQVVPTGDTPALVAAVLHLVQHPEMAEKVGLWNRNRIHEHFRLDQFIGAHEQVFRQLAPQ
jgi:glycosyltransferase involved in cell wall biosynthesis